MFNSMRIFDMFDKLSGSCCNKNSLNADDFDKVRNGINICDLPEENCVKTDKDKPEGPIASLYRFPFKKSFFDKIWWLYSWPLRFILTMTIPSPLFCKKWYPVTFMMCIIWIGVNSYIVSWSMTVIGNTFLIPDSVMGMTFLAFGGCIPEACSIFIMSRRGEGGIGVSNAIGANSLAILFALGLPWLIKILSLFSQGNAFPVVYINSGGIDFVISSLLAAVLVLYISLIISKFTLRKTLGVFLIFFYTAFSALAILVELGVIKLGQNFC